MKSRDVRCAAVLATTATVLIVGAVLSWWPDADRPAAWPGIQNVQVESRAEHATKQRQTEIKLRFEQGVVMLHAKQYEHAITAFHRVLEFAPKMPEAHANMGFALLGKGRFEAARDFFEGATELRHDQVNGYYGLALALKGLGDLPGAVGAMRVYLHRAPDADPFRLKANDLLTEWESTRRLSDLPRQSTAPNKTR